MHSNVKAVITKKKSPLLGLFQRLVMCKENYNLIVYNLKLDPIMLNSPNFKKNVVALKCNGVELQYQSTLETA